MEIRRLTYSLDDLNPYVRSTKSIDALVALLKVTGVCIGEDLDILWHDITGEAILVLVYL